MSAARQILEEAISYGVEITVVDDSLKCRSDEPLSPDLISKLKDQKHSILRLLKKRPETLPTGNTWIDNNRDFLEMAGFTDHDLFNTKSPKGIAHLNIWNKPDLSIELEGSTIYFSWEAPTGRRITQTCRPEIKLQ